MLNKSRIRSLSSCPETRDRKICPRMEKTLERSLAEEKKTVSQPVGAFANPMNHSMINAAGPIYTYKHMPKSIGDTEPNDKRIADGKQVKDRDKQ